MAAGITLAAIAVRVAHLLSGEVGTAPGANDYRLAFIALAMAVLASLIGIARLPHDAGDHFIGRGKA